MTSPRLTAATVVLAALGLAACSDGGGGTTAATPASGITSAATSAAPEPASPSDAFPSAAADLPTRAADGTVYPGETWSTRGRGPSASAHGGWRRSPTTPGRRSRRACSSPGRARSWASGTGAGSSPRQPREVFSVTKSITSTLVGMAQADGDLDVDDRAKRYIEEWRGTKSGSRHDPRHPQQRQRPVLGHRHRLRRPAAGRGPHPVRDRPQPAVPAGHGVDLQQRRHPDPRPGRLDGHGSGDPRLRRRAAVRSPRHDAHPDDGRPGWQHQHVLRHPDDVRGPGPLRLPVPPPRPLGRRPGRAAVVGEGGRGPAVQDHNAAYGFLWWLNRKGPIIGPLATDAPGQPTPPVGQTMPGLPANAFTAQGLGRSGGARRPEVGDRRGAHRAVQAPGATRTPATTPPGSSPRRWSAPLDGQPARGTRGPARRGTPRSTRPAAARRARGPRRPPGRRRRARRASGRSRGVPALEDVPLVEGRLVHGQRSEPGRHRQVGHLAQRHELVVASGQRSHRRRASAGASRCRRRRRAGRRAAGGRAGRRGRRRTAGVGAPRRAHPRPARPRCR